MGSFHLAYLTGRVITSTTTILSGSKTKDENLLVPEQYLIDVETSNTEHMTQNHELVRIAQSKTKCETIIT